MLVFGDLCMGFIALVFGFIIATVGCYKGSHRSGTEAWAGYDKLIRCRLLVVLIVDLFITRLLLYTFSL